MNTSVPRGWYTSHVRGSLVRSLVRASRRTACPLAMSARGIGYPAIANTISVHAVAMFLPGLVTGDVIKRTSCAAVMGLGVLLYGGSILIALQGETTAYFMSVSWHKQGTEG